MAPLLFVGGGSLCLLSIIAVLLVLTTGRKGRPGAVFVLLVLAASGAGIAVLGASTSTSSESASMYAARQLAHGGDTVRVPATSKAGLAELEYLSNRLNSSYEGLVQSISESGAYHYNVFGGTWNTNTLASCVVYNQTTTQWSYYSGSCK